MLLGADKVVAENRFKKILLRQLGFKQALSAAKVYKGCSLHFANIFLEVLDDERQGLERPLLDLLGKSLVVLQSQIRMVGLPF